MLVKRVTEAIWKFGDVPLNLDTRFSSYCQENLCLITTIWNSTELDTKHRNYAFARPSTFTPPHYPVNYPNMTRFRQKGTIMRKIHRAWPKWHGNQHAKFQAIPSMRAPANAGKPLRTDEWTDGQTDMPKTVTVGRMDRRTHVQVERGYFWLRTHGQTDGRTDGQTTRKHSASGALWGRHKNGCVVFNDVLMIGQI